MCSRVKWTLRNPPFVQEGRNKTVNGTWKPAWKGVESSSCVPDKWAGEGSPAMCDKGGYTSCDKE